MLIEERFTCIKYTLLTKWTNYVQHKCSHWFFLLTCSFLRSLALYPTNAPPIAPAVPKYKIIMDYYSDILELD